MGKGILHSGAVFAHCQQNKFSSLECCCKKHVLTKRRTTLLFMNEVMEKFTSLVSSDFACDFQEHDDEV